MRRPGGTLLLLCAAVILAGCGGAASPETAEPTSEPRRETPASDIPPGPLKAATEDISRVPADATPQDAVAFAEHWFQLVNDAYATGDVDALAEASHVDCMSCASILNHVIQRHGSGGRFTGGTVTVDVAEASPVDPDGAALVAIKYRQEPLIELDVDGSVDVAGEPESGTLAFHAIHAGDGWQAFELSYG